MIGIYGGTFDPVHFGHLRTALEVKEALGLTQMRLIPSARPPHRMEPAASAEMRLAMLQLAVAGLPGFIVDERELAREGASYMVDTLRSIRAEVAGEPMMLIIGADAFQNLPSWHRWENLFDYAHVVVMGRPGCGEERLELQNFFQERLAASAECLKEAACGRLFFQSVTQLEISATRIRRIFAAKKNPLFLLPEAVIKFIHKNRLYL